MGFQFPASAVPLAHQNPDLEVARRTANFHPTIWGDFFLAYDSNPAGGNSHEESEHELLKEEVRKMLLAAPEKSLQKLELIDAIQRLGVSYHFEKEIEASLNYMYHVYHECFQEDGCDIYAVALRFRLLRQQGHPISCEVFNKFMDANGKYDEALTSNVEGLLSLYEAAHLRVHEEDILEEALTFTTTHLESMVSKLSNFHATKVRKALKIPIRKMLTRLGAREYLSIYQQDELHNELLLKSAKLDFNILLKMHQKELSGITRWWKNLDVPKNFPFARDRLVECYYWILGVYYEPKYSLGREITTKIISLTSIMDDIYDVYGTFDELQILTNAIQRWDIAAPHELPSCMKHWYVELLDVFTKLENEFAEKGKSFAIDYAKQQMQKLNYGYFEEAKWCESGYVPKFEEYMKVALVTGAYMMLSTVSCAGMRDIVTPDVLEWVTNQLLIVMASSVICRLSDDSVGHEEEQERGDVASSIECYIKEYDTSKEVAYNEFRKRVTNAWKDINKECLEPLAVPMPFLTRVLNFARVINHIYKDVDGYTDSKGKLKNCISLVLVKPVDV